MWETVAEHFLRLRWTTGTAVSLCRQVPEHRKHTRLWRSVCLLSQAVSKMFLCHLPNFIPNLNPLKIWSLTLEESRAKWKKVTWIHVLQSWASSCGATGNIESGVGSHVSERTRCFLLLCHLIGFKTLTCFAHRRPEKAEGSLFSLKLTGLPVEMCVSGIAAHAGCLPERPQNSPLRKDDFKLEKNVWMSFSSSRSPGGFNKPEVDRKLLP